MSFGDESMLKPAGLSSETRDNGRSHGIMKAKKLTSPKDDGDEDDNGLCASREGTPSCEVGRENNFLLAQAIEVRISQALEDRHPIHRHKPFE
eukprot:6463289-Amphidinium_carterae.2